MDWNIVGLCGGMVAACVLCLLLRKDHPTAAALCALGALCTGFLAVLPGVLSLFGWLREVGEGTTPWLSTLLRCAVIAWCADLAAELCEAADEKGLGKVCEWAGRVGVVLACLPMLFAFLQVLDAFAGS